MSDSGGPRQDTANDFVRNATDLFRRLRGDGEGRRATGATTTGGAHDDAASVDAFRNPMTEVGDTIRGGVAGAPARVAAPAAAGKVYTSVASGADFVPSWQDPAGGGGGRYRGLLYELDGLGGFEWIVDEDGHPMYELMELE